VGEISGPGVNLQDRRADWSRRRNPPFAVDEKAGYAFNDSEPAADRILLAISDKIELLRNHARLGPRRPAGSYSPEKPKPTLIRFAPRVCIKFMAYSYRS
jgi:hypothetical protein